MEMKKVMWIINYNLNLIFLQMMEMEIIIDLMIIIDKNECEIFLLYNSMNMKMVEEFLLLMYV
jgi:hypothetical protein